MDMAMSYNGTLTAEQFLFYEMRIVSKQYLENKSIEEIIAYIKRDNLFQYPTERKISKLARACHKRLVALDNEKLVYEVANAPVEVAKQINLYAMMRYNRLVREFMEGLIGEKYRQHDFSYTKKDNILLFFVGYHFYEIETESTGVGDYILISKRQRIRNKADVKTVLRVFEKLLIDTKGGK